MEPGDARQRHAEKLPPSLRGIVNLVVEEVVQDKPMKNTGQDVFVTKHALLGRVSSDDSMLYVDALSDGRGCRRVSVQ